MHWLETVLTLLQAETANLRELALLADANPATFYRGVTLEGVELSGQDLRGMELCIADLRVIKTDRFTIFDPAITSRDVSSNDAGEVQAPEIRDSEWPASWLAKWESAAYSEIPRLVDVATEWLSSEAISTIWVHVLKEVWQAAGHDAARHARLFDLSKSALVWDKLDANDWKSIWLQLWKHVGAHPAYERDLLATLAVDFLNKTSVDFDGWSPIWRRLFAARIYLDNSEEIIALGSSWLKTVNLEHAGWPSVWRDLRKQKSEQNAAWHNELAIAWLSNASPTRFEWPGIWRFLWERSSQPKFWDTSISGPHDRLVTVGISWLGRVSPKREAWKHVWSDVWSVARKHPHLQELLFASLINSLQQQTNHQERMKEFVPLWNAISDSGIARERLTEIAIRWLSQRNYDDMWGHDWLQLWGLRRNAQLTGELVTRARQALPILPKGSARYTVWKHLWRELNAVQFVRRELTEIAEQWIAQFPKEGVPKALRQISSMIKS